VTVANVGGDTPPLQYVAKRIADLDYGDTSPLSKRGHVHALQNHDAFTKRALFSKRRLVLSSCKAACR
jgi:hypothetical protein